MSFAKVDHLKCSQCNCRLMVIHKRTYYKGPLPIAGEESRSEYLFTCFECGFSSTDPAIAGTFDPAEQLRQALKATLPQPR